MITHLEPDILEYEIKWALGSITTNKKVIVMEFQLSYFYLKRLCCKSVAFHMPANLENSAVATGLEKVSFHSNPKERQCQKCSNYCTTALISHASKVMLKILQARLQQYVNCELPEVQNRELPDGFKKGRGTRDQIASIRWITETAREFEENVYFCFIDYAKAFDCVDHNKLWKILKEMGIPDHLTCLLRNLYAGLEAQLELDMEQQTGSKLGKEYVKAIYCHSTYLTYMQSTS